MEANPEQVNCWRCENPLLEEQQQVELLCHHKMHTACFLQIAHQNYNCGLCNQQINPNQHINQPNPTHITQDQIRNLYETDDTFKKFAQTLAQKRRIFSQRETAYLKLIKAKKEEIREQLLTIKAQLEGLTETKKTEIRESQVYKDYLAAHRGYSYWIGKLRTRYNCSERKFANSMREKRGFRRFRSIGWRQYRRSKLNYAFYYRLRI